MELQIFNAGNVPSKQEIQQAAEMLNDRYNEGGVDVNPIKDYLQLKALEAYIKAALPIAQPWATEMASRYNDAERRNLYGAQVSIKTGAIQYDFSGLQHIAELEQKAAKAKDDLSKANDALKSAKEKAIKLQQARVAGKEPDSLMIRF